MESTEAENIKEAYWFFLLNKGISNKPVYRNINDNSLWQDSYKGKYKTFNRKVNSFPFDEKAIIEKYGYTPYELIKQNIFVELEIDDLILI